jgi:hypothetical protein
MNFMQRTYIQILAATEAEPCRAIDFLETITVTQHNSGLTESRVNADCQANEKMIPYGMTAAGHFNRASGHQYQINLVTAPVLVLTPRNGLSLLMSNLVIMNLVYIMPLYDTATNKGPMVTNYHISTLRCLPLTMLGTA